MTKSADQLKYLLLQIRKLDDPMREHEVRCFARGLGCDFQNISIHDLIGSSPSLEQYRAVDAVLIGGSGDYSVVTGGPWFDAAIESFQVLYEKKIPTFASCWGFQAFAAALGGRVVHDLNRAELGTPEIKLTQHGLVDPLFQPLGSKFRAQMGHEDIVDEIPNDAILLASTDRVTNQAFTFSDRLIYATQFHPELEAEDLILRLEAYPRYVEKISGMQFEEFKKLCQPTRQVRGVLRRFADALTDHVNYGASVRTLT